MNILEKLSVIDIVTVIIYIIAMIGIGAYCSKKIKSAKDFTSAGQSLSWKMIAGSSFATCMGANVLIGKYDVIYESGVSGFISSLFWYIGWFFLIIMAKRLRDSGAVSIPSFLGMRYNSTTVKIASYCVLVVTISNTASQFLSIGTILDSLGICSKTAGTIAGALLVLLFTVFSGLWGVAITDTIQAVIMIVTFGVFFPIAVIKTAGGWGNIVANSTPEYLSVSKGMAPIALFGWFISSLAAGIDTAQTQRVFSAKSTKDALLGQGAAWVISTLICGFITAVPALAIHVIFPDITAGSYFTPTFIGTYFPVVIKGLVLAALFSLLFTSGDSYLLVLSSTVTDDIIKNKKKELTDEQYLKYTRITCVVSTVVITFVALYVGKIYQLIKTGGGSYAAGVFFPILFGCFWKRANAKAINIAMISGTSASILYDLFLKVPFGFTLDGCVIGIFINLIICVAGTLILEKKEMAAA